MNKKRNGNNFPLKLKVVDDERNSIIFWLIMSFTALFLFVSPFHKGLFNGELWAFEGPIYAAVLWSSVALLFLSIYFSKIWKFDNIRDLFGVLIWLIPISFLVSTLNAASHHSAMNSVLIHVMYSVFFLIGLYFTKSKLGLNVTSYVILGSGYMLVFYGLMNWLGHANYKDAVLDSRLSNVFQYPNTYAAFLLAFFIVTLLLVSLSKKWFSILLYGMMLVPIFSSLLLTLSRGALLFLPIGVLIYLCFIPWYRQLTTLINIVISSVASLFILQRLTILREKIESNYALSLSINGWLMLFIVSVAASILIYIVQTYIDMKLDKKYRVKQGGINHLNWINPTILLVLGVLGLYLLFQTTLITDKLPSSLQTRIESVTTDSESAESRTVFYTDSAQVVKDYPLFGAGGGAWANLYDSYKSYPYTSRQAHNFFLQYMVEVGLVGFLIFIAVAGLAVLSFVKYYLAHRYEGNNERRLLFMIIPMVIVLHSMIDFNLTYLYLGSLVFLCIGALASTADQAILPPMLKLKSERWRLVLALALAITSVIVMYSTFQKSMAFSTIKEKLPVTLQTGDYHRISEVIDQAIRLDPNNPTYEIQKISLDRQVYTQTKDEKYYEMAKDRIKRLMKQEPFDLQLINELITLLLSKGDMSEALQYVKHYTKVFPWDLNLYEKQMDVLLNLYYKADKAIGTKYFEEAEMAYQIVVKKRKELDSLSYIEQMISRNFQIETMHFYMGKIYLYHGELEKASELLRKSGFSDDFTIEYNRNAARWYLASLQLQDTNDQSIYDSLIKHDPAEAEAIKEIMLNTSNFHNK